MRAHVYLCAAVVGALLFGGAGATADTIDGGVIAVGQTQELNLDGGASIAYKLTVDAAGILTFVTRGEGGDLVLEVLDGDNQQIRGGQADVDLFGNMANEQLVVEIPWEETWVLKINNVADAVSKVKAVVGFVAFPAVAREPDTDGRPSQATPLEIGATREDSLNAPEFDGADWYKVVAPEDGRLSIFTQGDEGLDIAIRVVTGDDYSTVVVEGDSDLEGRTSSEGVVIPVRAGVAYYVQILGIVDSAGKYRVGTQFTKF